jgi:hypothetical protein
MADNSLPNWTAKVLLFFELCKFFGKKMLKNMLFSIKRSFIDYFTRIPEGV